MEFELTERENGDDDDLEIDVGYALDLYLYERVREILLYPRTQGQHLK